MSAAGETPLKSNTVIVVLGASGDLAKKKTFPALFGLYNNGFLPKGIKIVGYARTKMSDEDYHKRVSQYIKAPIPAMKTKLEEFLKLCTYVAGTYDEDSGFQALEKELNGIEDKYEDKNGGRNRVFYMALPPSVFTTVAAHLKKNNYSEGSINRIIVEKPFGMDLESSRKMNVDLTAQFKEDEIFRIDHYLGKEMVKNLLVLRFANVMFDASFNKNLIDNVQITFKEPFGTEGRGGYFDEFGIIRDVMQNHLLQVLSILTMERPVSFSSEDIRDEKVKVLRYIPPIEFNESLLGQYVKTQTKDGEKPGYLDDDTVPKDSICPTFAATVLHINSPRWEGVPFILKAGKALNEQKTEIRIQYKDVTQGIFKDIARNELVIRVQPGEAVYFKMNSKTPGLTMATVPTEMDLTYKRRFSDLKIPEAYEALILDAFNGDHSNFVRGDELDAAWGIFTPLLHHIENSKPKPEAYDYGSRGPAGLDDFITKNGGYKRSDKPYTWPSTALPVWVKRINDVLEHEKNKDVLDTKNIVVATVQDGHPYARYHVFRGFVEESDKVGTELILTTTDKLMGKVAQIHDSATDNGGSPSEFVFWASPTGDQIRVHGLIHLLDPTQPASDQSVSSLLSSEFDWEQYRREQWKKISAHLKASFTNPAPGSEWPKGKSDEEVLKPDRLEPGDELEEEALKRFCLVVLEPTFVDLSEVNASPPRRTIFRKQEDGSWTESKVAP